MTMNNRRIMIMKDFGLVEDVLYWVGVVRRRGA